MDNLAILDCYLSFYYSFIMCVLEKQLLPAFFSSSGRAYSKLLQ